MTRSRLINTTKEKSFEPGVIESTRFFSPPSSLWLWRLKLLSSTRMWWELARWKSRRILIASLSLSFFAAWPRANCSRTKFNLERTGSLFSFYFHCRLERAVSTIGYFSSKSSPISLFDRILLLFVLLSFFFFLIPLCVLSFPPLFFFFIAESTFPTKRWFRVLNKIREPNSVGIICLSSGRTHVSFQSDGFISCPLINRHFHWPCVRAFSVRRYLTVPGVTQGR